MEAQRPQPGGNVGVHLIFHGFGANLLVAKRTALTRSGVNRQPHHSSTILIRLHGSWPSSRNPVTCVHVPIWEVIRVTPP